MIEAKSKEHLFREVFKEIKSSFHEIELAPIIGAVFVPNGFNIYLDYDHEDFWLDLGPCWGFFKGSFRGFDRLPPNYKYGFVLTEIRMKDGEPPTQLIGESDMLVAKNYPKIKTRLYAT